MSLSVWGLRCVRGASASDTPRRASAAGVLVARLTLLYIEQFNGGVEMLRLPVMARTIAQGWGV